MPFTGIAVRFYVDGNCPKTASVNGFFFGVNIAHKNNYPSIFPLALLVAAYLHYRNKRRNVHPLHLPEDGVHDPSETTLLSAPPADREQDKLRSSNNRLASSLFAGDPTAALPEEGGNAYRGLLWMKDKYEQYREHTDRKIEKLKEELAHSEDKYLNLLAARSPLRIEGLQLELEQRIRDYHQLQAQYQDEQARTYSSGAG